MSEGTYSSALRYRTAKVRPADDDDSSNNNGSSNNNNSSNANNSSNFLDPDVESGSSKLSSTQTKQAEFSIWAPSTWLNFLNVIKIFRHKSHQQRKRQWQVPRCYSPLLGSGYCCCCWCSCCRCCCCWLLLLLLTKHCAGHSCHHPTIQVSPPPWYSQYSQYH